MSAGRRVFFGIFAIAAFLAAVVTAFLPRWNADAGLTTRVSTGGALRIAVVTPGGAAAKAGIRSGDILDYGALSLHDRLAVDASSLGYTVRIPVRRGHTHFAAIVRYSGEPVSPPTWTIVVAVLSAGVYLVLILLLLRKAVDRLDGRLLLYVLVVSLVGQSVEQPFLARDPATSEILSYVLGNGAAIVYDYFLARFVVHAPSRQSPHTVTFERLIVWFTFGEIAACAYAFISVLVPALEFAGFGVKMSSIALWGADVAVLLLIVAIICDGLAHTAKRERVQLQWIASTLSLAVFIEIFRAVYYFLYYNFTGIPSFGWLGPVSVLEDFALVGAAYAVLRHRLIDMELIVSRTAIFTAVSAVLVVIFVALEWVGTIVAERVLGNFGSAAAYSGIGAALIAGLSARPVHAAVERRLNRVFFSRQARNEEALRRFARESEVATDAERLMDSAFTTLSKHVEGAFVAILVREDGGFRCVNSTLPLSQETIGENEPLALRLRRFAEPFELDDPGNEFHHAVFVPMTVLGRVIAFIVCGAKPDRTRYAERETDTLTQFAQRIGTAYVLLREKREIWVPAEVG